MQNTGEYFKVNYQLFPDEDERRLISQSDSSPFLLLLKILTHAVEEWEAMLEYGVAEEGQIEFRSE